MDICRTIVSLLGHFYKDIDDKADGILPYAFHLVCENNDMDNFWTEKLADAYLGWALPIFSGCANIDSYFPADSFIKVNLKQPEEALKTIQTALNTPDFYQKHLPAIKVARERLLNEYNLFTVINNLIKKHQWDFSKKLENPIHINPQNGQKHMINRIIKTSYHFSGRVIRRLKNTRFYLPLYFKIANRNWSFFTDYHDNLGKKTMTQGYYSQRGQDWFIDQKIFPNKTDGIFLDVGANDPKDLSNTLYFEEKGWSGLAFEPQERLRKKWDTDRKTKCLPHLLGARDGEEVTFVEYDTDDWQNALSGVEGFAIEEGVNVDHMPKKRTTMKKRRLDKILQEQNILNIDFMSLDVEGFEMEVLQGINFQKINIDVIVVENDRTHMGDKTLRRFIKEQGYEHIARLSGDDIFRKIGAGKS